MPKYKYTEMEGHTFVNPYTFVPYDRTALDQERKQAWQGEEKVTGYLDCRLTVKTPLAVPGEQYSKKYQETKHYSFFSVSENEYRIPGSSIRGMLRNVYEALTNSCFSTMRENTQISKRADVRDGFQAGLLIKDGEGRWKLFKAKKYLVPCKNYKSNEKWWYLKQNKIVPECSCYVTEKERILDTNSKDKISYGESVQFFPTKSIPAYKEGKVWDGVAKTITPCRDKEDNPNGYMFIGEPFFKKHGEEIFVRDKEELSFSAQEIDTALQLLKESRNIYRDKAINKEYDKSHFGYAGFEKAEERGVIPLWYHRKMKRFSFAYAGRISFKRTLDQLVKQSAPCKSRNKVCKACDLFGMTGDGTGALGSRIRITDAVFEKGTGGKPKPETLKELGTPRSSYMNFYSTTYRAESEKDADDAKSYDDNGVDIRGRKFYWHYGLDETGTFDICHCQASKEDLKNSSKRDRLSSFDLMKKGSFRFQIYYDDITRTQLNELMWCVTLGENDINSKLWHKIGHGKPLGLGSCKVTIEDRVERAYQKQEDIFSYKTEHKSDGLAGEWKEKNEWQQALLKVCNSQTITNPKICYPYIDNPDHITCKENEIAAHQWFKKYKEEGVLPYITDDSQTLPVYKIEEVGTVTQKKNKRT